MRLNLRDYPELLFLTGGPEIPEAMPSVRRLRPFSEEVTAFLGDLSGSLMRAGREYSDVVTFAYWCRRSALRREREKYDDLENRLGRGIVFHVAPSNVAVNFAFSLAAGLLAGNANIVRLPSRDFAQVRVISRCINELLAGQHRNLAPYLCLVRYPSGSPLTGVFSALCDCRVIWGGDATIAEIRKSPLKPRAGEITFADRYSLAVLDADAYLAETDPDRLARDFYNDTYFSDQNACTAPRLVAWLGRERQAAKARFWERLRVLAGERYTLTPVQAVGKLNAAYRAAALRGAEITGAGDPLLIRAQVRELADLLPGLEYNSGFFLEYDVEDLTELLPLCTERCQTLSYYGLARETLEAFLETARPAGPDRIVPIGRTMDFSLDWDGHGLIRELSRKVTIL